MFRKWSGLWPFVLISVIFCPELLAQSSQPTTGILFNTLMIRNGHDAGTMFAVQVDNREYWLTAKHILTGRKSGPAGEVKEKEISLQVLDPVGTDIKWDEVKFKVIDPGKDVDIVVLVPTTTLTRSDIQPLKISSERFEFGDECSFLGYPFAQTWMATFKDYVFKMPYIKHCYISGMIQQPVKVLVLDGINNPGFSGGPVLYKTGPNQVVIGVISGYHSEPGQVHSIEVPNDSTAVQMPKNTKVKHTGKESVVDLNTGIIIAYIAEPIVDAVRTNPIGQPLHQK